MRSLIQPQPAGTITRTEHPRTTSNPNQQLTLNSQQLTVSSQQSTANSQQPTVNSQQTNF
jgi:hypothetical protein